MLLDTRNGNPGAVTDAEVDRASALHPLAVVGGNSHDVGPSSMREVCSSKLKGGVALRIGSAAPSRKMSIRLRGLVMPGSCRSFVCHQDYSHPSSRMRRLMWPCSVSPGWMKHHSV